MRLLKALEDRSNNCCEICNSTENISAIVVAPKTEEIPENQIVICSTCNNQISEKEELNSNHWRCLNESMWSEVEGVKVIAYRILKKLENEDWATNLLGMIYLEDETLEWAQWTAAPILVHKDVNGNVLENGDTVTLVKDLQVKGTGSFKAKQGYAVRRIRLDPDDANLIGGKVEGQDIMILTQFVKKQLK